MDEVVHKLPFLSRKVRPINRIFGLKLLPLE